MSEQLKQKEPKLLNNEKYQTVPVETLDRLYASEKELKEIKQKEQKKEFHIPSYLGIAHYNPAPIEQKEQKPKNILTDDDSLQTAYLKRMMKKTVSTRKSMTMNLTSRKRGAVLKSQIATPKSCPS